MKTVSVALVLCLNVGVDPPDVVKTTPCARLECWIGKSRGSPRRVTCGLRWRKSLRKTSKSVVVGFYNFLRSVCPKPGTQESLSTPPNSSSRHLPAPRRRPCSRPSPRPAAALPAERSAGGPAPVSLPLRGALGLPMKDDISRRGGGGWMPFIR